VSWFDADENNSSQVSARLAADATTVKGAIGDRISIVVQNFTLMVALCVITFSLQWKMAFVVLATFPLQVFATFVEVIHSFTFNSFTSLYATKKSCETLI
jgi:ATP-binding cassette subfamily B (MDR/TAP) protein 1